MASAPADASRADAPPLEGGDRIATREEFHRRYLMNPAVRRAEYIDGVVYVSSPASRNHSTPHGILGYWLRAYVLGHPGIGCELEITVLLPGGQEVQPDVLLWREEGGGARLTPDGYLEGAPELIAEVAASSASYDLHAKKDAYRRAGVPEYLVWRVFDRRVDWWRLRDGEYVPLEPDAEGVLTSVTFPGLRLHPQKVVDGDLAGLFA